MAWKVELSAAADRDLDKLDPQHAKRILKFLLDRLARLENPRSMRQALQGKRFGEFWIIERRLPPRLQDRGRQGADSSAPRRPPP